MSEFETNKSNDAAKYAANDARKLSSLLAEWTVPGPPVSLGARLERARAPWWQRVFTASIPVPVPVAVGFSLVLAYGAWQVSAKPTTCVSQAPTAQTICATAREC